MTKDQHTWLGLACAKNAPDDLMDILEILEVADGMVVATDRNRLHLLQTDQSSDYPPAPKMVRDCLRKMQATEFVSVEPEMWAPGGEFKGQKLMTHIFEGTSINWTFFQEANFLGGMRCAICKRDPITGPIRLSDPFSGVVAYIMPINTKA